ncbi:SDR family oxidoreductase [Sulfitobacter sp. MF3-043]|uniref:SDR family oxidoreductase n=1 Tax=Sulfitobacter sediminivivens TaxID=3252902 RepID=UPI003EBD5439
MAELLMARGGSLKTLSFLGAEKVVDHYNLMGPVQAALETSVRFLAHELWGGHLPAAGQRPHNCHHWRNPACRCRLSRRRHGFSLNTALRHMHRVDDTKGT